MSYLVFVSNWLLTFAACPLGCVHGTCRDYCVCDAGWAGDDCSFFLMGDDDLIDNCPGDCSGHGKCYSGTCECDKGWTHSTCSVPVACLDNCNSPAGRCEAGTCVCEVGFIGATCAVQKCPYDCWGHGQCRRGNCICSPEWSGEACDVSLIAVCDPPCRNDGRCVRDVCLCPQGWTGGDCSRPMVTAGASPQHVVVPTRDGATAAHLVAQRQMLDQVKTRSQKEQADLDSLQARGKLQKTTHASRDSLERNETVTALERPSITQMAQLLHTARNTLPSPNAQARNAPNAPSTAPPANVANHTTSQGASQQSTLVTTATGTADSHDGTALNATIEPQSTALPFIKDLGPLPSLMQVIIEQKSDAAPKETPHSNPATRNASANLMTVTETPISQAETTAEKLESLARRQEEEGTKIRMRDAVTPSHAAKTSVNTPKKPSLRGGPSAAESETIPSVDDEDSPRTAARSSPHRDAVQLHNTGADTVVAPSACNGSCVHGHCDADGKCACDEDYTGTYCDTKRCRMDCNHQGLCLNEQCVCSGKYFGDACQHKRCPDDCSGQGSCANGQCACMIGYTGDNCATAAPSQPSMAAKYQMQTSERTSTDEVNIGQAVRVIQQQQDSACVENCNQQGKCDNGTCQCYTGYSGVACQNYCPNECSRQGECIKGACLCFAGFLGVDCSIKGCCSGHGACDTPELCVCDAGWSGEDCSIPLVCPEPDCGGHGQCVNGMCECNPGFTGPTCADAAPACDPPCNPGCTCNDVTNACECKGGFTGVAAGKDGKGKAQKKEGSGTTTGDILPSGKKAAGSGPGAPDAASGCGKDGSCSSHGKCNKGTDTCECEKDWFHHDCSEQHCPEFDGNVECAGHGLCINAVCHCTPGWGLAVMAAGPNLCVDKVCEADCGRHGNCVSGACVCLQGFGGSTCRDLMCPHDCSGHGVCQLVSMNAPPECTCNQGWSGLGCAQVAFTSLLRSCVNNCKGNGLCFNGKCVCNAGFTGVDCSDRACNEVTIGPHCNLNRCPNDCDGKGLCFDGHCSCWGNYVGIDCSVPRLCYGPCREACQLDTRSEKCIFCVGQCMTAESPVLGHHNPFDDLVGT